MEISAAGLSRPFTAKQPDLHNNVTNPQPMLFACLYQGAHDMMKRSMKVITIYGSKSDLPFMEPARVYFQENNIEHEEVVYSAHRDLPALIAYLQKLEQEQTKAVLLCVAGLSAALPGVVVMNTELPVIGVPVPCGPLNGVDALLAISQLPGGVPATTVGLHKKTPLNAAMAAHRIIRLAQ